MTFEHLSPSVHHNQKDFTKIEYKKMEMHPGRLAYLIVGGIFLCFVIIGYSVVFFFYFGFLKKCKSKYDLLLFILGSVDFMASVGNLLVDSIGKLSP